MSIRNLVKRNILVYIRNRANIFFSLLSMIIIIGLMALFLADMNANNVVQLLKEYSGERDSVLDKANAKQLVMMWSIAGIIVVNSVSVTLAMIGSMVADKDEHRLSSFMVSPVNRISFVLGYILAAIIVGFVMCVLTVILAEVIVFSLGGSLLTVGQFVKVMLLILVNVFTYSSLSFMLAAFVNTMSAFSGLNTIIGTLVGFLAAIYLPMGMLPEKVQNVLKCLPLLHGSSLMREVFTEKAIINTFTNSPVELIDAYKQTMGITITWNEKLVPNSFKVIFLLLCGIIFIVVSAIILKRRNAEDR